ncbi:methionine adenosyltransferase [Candidatus Fermentibacteria bacterium]|nr:MAG: methionine adenosyltransferase [Candidatus Fermentibacteria bacterium]
MEKPMRKLFTSESVSEGHPDKVCDQISDAVLDAHLKLDPDSHVACETLVTTNYCVLAGEVRGNGEVDYESVVRETIRDIGYTLPEIGFHYKNAEFVNRVHSQSQDINEGVVNNEGAGDQGMMFGYACNDTRALMPYPVHLSHRLLEKLSEVRRAGNLHWARPDAKSQVTVIYENGIPVGIQDIVMSIHHSADIDNELMEKETREKILAPVLEGFVPQLPWSGRFLYNPSGRFVIGGPDGDTGVTGRKIIVDTYGGMGRHGGGAFSGKDSTKVDRSAAYMARYIAKNIVAAGIASRCEIQLAYAIGKAEPVSVRVDTFGTEKIADISDIETAVRDIFPLRPYQIIKTLGLKKSIFRKTAAFGHFGRIPGDDGSFSWEKTAKAEELASRLLG